MRTNVSNTSLKSTLFVLLGFLAACSQPTGVNVSPPVTQAAFQPKLLGSLELDFDTTSKTATVSNFKPVTRASFVNETSLKFTPLPLLTLDDVPNSTRFLTAGFTLENLSATPRTNLSLVAYHRRKPGFENVNGGAIFNIQDFGGGATDPLMVRPAHGMKTSGPAIVVDDTKADLQIFKRSEVTTLEADANLASLINNGVSGEAVLHYGYVARNASGGRSIPANSNNNTLTIAVRVPQSTDTASSAYRFSMTFLVFEDSNTRVTESLEEQGVGSSAQARATALGGSPEIVGMCGTSLSGATYVTGVRTAGVGADLAVIGGKFLITDPSAPAFTVNGNIQKSFNSVQGVMNGRFQALAGATLSAALTGSPTNGSNVNINADGSLSINPKANLRTSDSFNYTVSDGTCTSSSRPASLSVQNAETWFVNNSVLSSGDGRFTNPFKTLIEAQNASIAGDTIYAYNGDNATTGQNAGITLKANQKLIGQGVALVVGTDTIEVAGSAAKIGNGAGVAVTLNANNTVQGLDISSAGAGSKGVSGSSFGSLTLNSTSISSNAGPALDLSTGTINATLSSLSSTNSTSTGINLNSTAGNLTLGAGSISNSSGTGLNVVGGTLSLTDSGSLSQANNAALVSISGGHSSGTISFDTGTLSATNGTGVQFDNADGTYNFNGTTTLNGGNAGVDVLNGSSGTINFLSGSSITNPTGIGLNVNTSNPTLGFAGSITNNNNRVVTVDTLSGGNVTLSGNLSSSGSGTGILVQNSTAGTINLSGSSKTLSTGSNTAVTLSSNTGATINFTNGGLGITTTSATGLNATGGGTITVQGSNNTISSTTGTALNMANTTIGSSSLNFKSISANGATNGIVLNNTGSSGGLTVTGDGTNNASGGTIQNITNEGISLFQTRDTALTSMKIQNTGRSGIDGTQVTNFSFINGTIDNSGTSGTVAVGQQYSNIGFNANEAANNNLSGTFTVTGSTLTNAFNSGVDLRGANSTVSNAIISNNTISSSTLCDGGGAPPCSSPPYRSQGQGINIVGLGTLTTVFSLTKATISNNDIQNFPGGGGIQIVISNASGTFGSGGPQATAGIPNDASNIISVTGNKIKGLSSTVRINTSAIIYSLGGRARGNVDISNNGTVANPLTNMTGTTILVGVNGLATATVTTNNNVIVANNGLGSPGIGGGCGITFGNTDTCNMTWTLIGNAISQTDGNGMLAVSRGVAGTLNLKIQNNTVAAPLGGVRPGIRVDSGNAGSSNETVCLNISGNTSAGSGGTNGIGLRKQGTVPTTNAFKVNGMAATATPNIENYINGLNPSASGTLLISATSGFSSCTLP